MRTFWGILITLTALGFAWLVIDPQRDAGDAVTITAPSDGPPVPSSGRAPPTRADADRNAPPADPGANAPPSSEPAGGRAALPSNSTPSDEVASRPSDPIPSLDASLGIVADAPESTAKPDAGTTAATDSEPSPGSGEAISSVPSASASPIVSSATGHTGAPVPQSEIDRVRSAATRSTSGARTTVGRFDLPGAGTAGDPAEVPWELLVSAMEDYRPREGKAELPQWAKDLSGKHVRVTGFVLFPTFGTKAKELLLMKNQWDGCCIGMPPTPYDAIEITLGTPVDLANTAVNYASITGVLQVDPYLVNGWLLGLYLMEGATLETIGGSGAGGY